MSTSIPGAPATALPSGTTAGLQYYAQPVGSDALRLSLTSGGSPLASFATAGIGLLGLLVDHGPYLDASIDDFAEIIDFHAIAHKSPMVARVLKGINARGAADSYVGAHGAGSPALKLAYDQSGIARRRELDERMLQSLLSGRALKIGDTDATPSTAENGAVLVQLEGRGFLDDSEDSRV